MSEQGLSNMVRKYRRWSDLSQTQLADRVSVTRQTVANIERGNYSPSVHLALLSVANWGALWKRSLEQSRKS